MKSRPIAVNPDPENCERAHGEVLLAAIEGFCQLANVALLRFRCANLLSWILVFSAFAAFHGAFGVEFSTASVAGKKVTICRVDLIKERLQLFHRDETGMPFKRFNRLAAWLQARDQKLVFAMNAGMYHPDFSAVGLFISEGKQLAPLNLAAGKGNFFLKPNGVFAVTEKGACVVESSEFPKLSAHALLATQSGRCWCEPGAFTRPSHRHPRRVFTETALAWSPRKSWFSPFPKIR